MSPGEWIALNEARMDDLRVRDALNARVCAVVASTVPRKSKKRIRDKDFRLFPDNAPARKKAVPSELLLQKMRVFAAINGLEVKRA